MTTYDKGDLVRCSAVFTNASGTALNPSAVFFQFTNPAGVTTTYTYGTDAALVRDSTGDYHVDVDASLNGIWAYRFHSTGSGQAAGEGQFFVESAF